MKFYDCTTPREEARRIAGGRERRLDFDAGQLVAGRTMAFGSLERQADLEDLDRVELEFRVQAALDGGGLAKAVLLAGKQQITNWFALAAQHFDQGLRLVRWHDGVLGSLKEDNWFR
jgi:hypothetical protein